MPDKCLNHKIKIGFINRPIWIEILSLQSTVMNKKPRLSENTQRHTSFSFLNKTSHINAKIIINFRTQLSIENRTLCTEYDIWNQKKVLRANEVQIIDDLHLWQAQIVNNYASQTENGK